jgi:lysophospholipase L1-like esterase
MSERIPRWVIPVAGVLGATTLISALLFRRQVKEWFPTPVVGGGKRRTEEGWSGGSPPRPGRVLLIGDSIGAHGGFVRYLDEQLPGHTFDNQAVVGYSTGRMLAVAERHIRPNVYSEIIIEGDLNDGDRTSNWTKSNLRRLYQMARDAGARVVAITSTPWRGYARWNQAGQDRQDEVRRWIMAGADGLIDVAVNAYTPLEDAARPGHLNPEYASRDNLHLNSTGQRVMGEVIHEEAYLG